MYVVPSVHLYFCLSKLPQDFVSLKQLLLKYGHSMGLVVTISKWKKVMKQPLSCDTHIMFYKEQRKF